MFTPLNSKLHPKQLTSIPTHTHPLPFPKPTIPTPNQPTYNLLIPPKTLTQFTNILHHSHQLLDILITQNQLLFKTKHLLFFSTLLDTNYPHT
ncbi:DNA polymerase III subunit beta family protein, partial [Priestia megaterium]